VHNTDKGEKPVLQDRDFARARAQDSGEKPGFCSAPTGLTELDHLEHRLAQVEAGLLLNRAELLELYDVEQGSAAEQLILDTAQRLGRRLADNQGQVYAQIGVDGRPCPGNCQFCNYAVMNSGTGSPTTDGSLTGNSSADTASADTASADNLSVSASPIDSPSTTPFDVPPQQVVAYAAAFAQAGVHLISLMATAAYDFDTYCDLVEQVRDAVGADMPLLANVGDLSLAQAQRLKVAGINACYHTVRLGEGTLTSIKPAHRLRTCANIQKAGLKLMSGVEPLHEGQSAAEVVDAILTVARLRPLGSGVCTITAVAGTSLAHLRPLNTMRKRFVAALARLAFASTTRLGFVGGIDWVDAGADPRARSATLTAIETDFGDKVQDAKLRLEGDGWRIPRSPTGFWL
jgi:biotin synthase